MATINLELDSRTPKKGTNLFPIKLILRHESTNRPLKLANKYYCSEQEWNTTTQEITKSFKGAKRANIYLDNQRGEARTILQNIMDKNPYLKIKELKIETDKARHGDNIKPGRITLRNWSDILILRTRKAGSNSTANWYRDSVNAMIKFNKNKDIIISDIDVKFLNDYKADHLSRGGSLNGTAAYFRGLRSVINKANAEYPECNSQVFKTFKIKEKKTIKRAVKKDVIDSLRKLKFDPSTKEGLADWNAHNYLFFMFNNRGMNFIDIAKLKKKQIVETVYEKGKLISGRLNYIRSKNQKFFSMNLTRESIKILNCYDFKNKNAQDFIFPIGFSEGQTGLTTYQQKRSRNNKRFRKFAKQIGEDNLNLTTYVIRHSWASIAKGIGVSKDIIGESLGHEDPKVTEVYLESFENKVLDDVNEMIVG
ncbi:MAG: site-specific integrase [Flavobacteriales bacterium]|nr:site-specific integrase [Flavobacteriales bacterium]